MFMYEKILKYIDDLKENFCIYWTEAEENAHISACISIEEKIKSLIKEEAENENKRIQN